MTHTTPLNLYVCFNPTFSLNSSTDLTQGCWVIITRTNSGNLLVHTRGCDNQTFHLESGDARSNEAAWALSELIMWQWKYGLHAVPENRAPLSAFLSDESDGKPWALMRRLFERTVHVRDLEETMGAMLCLQRQFSLPKLVNV